MHDSNDIGMNQSGGSLAAGEGGPGGDAAIGAGNLTEVYKPRSRSRRAKTPEVFAPKRGDYLVKILKVVAVVAVLGFGGYYALTSYQNQRAAIPINRVSPILEQNVRNNPRDTGARVTLANAYLNQGFYDQAISQYDQALKLNNKSEAAVVGIGLCYMAKKDEDKALEYFEKEIEIGSKGDYSKINNNLETAYYNAGSLWFRRNHYDKALDYFKQAAYINSGSSDTYKAIGQVLIEKKQYKEAVTEFERAINFDPKYDEAYYGLGICYEHMGRPDVALMNYKKAVSISPGFTLAKKAAERLEHK
ncbi:MAG: tetratricopeptide repeat protein [Chloroflexi bacterium]|nr:tetratricopeptide repeat protein [Chloroflexota bacterium]